MNTKPHTKLPKWTTMGKSEEQNNPSPAKNHESLKYSSTKALAGNLIAFVKPQDPRDDEVLMMERRMYLHAQQVPTSFSASHASVDLLPGCNATRRCESSHFVAEKTSLQEHALVELLNSSMKFSDKNEAPLPRSNANDNENIDANKMQSGVSSSSPPDLADAANSNAFVAKIGSTPDRSFKTHDNSTEYQNVSIEKQFHSEKKVIKKNPRDKAKDDKNDSFFSFLETELHQDLSENDEVTRAIVLSQRGDCNQNEYLRAFYNIKPVNESSDKSEMKVSKSQKVRGKKQKQKTKCSSPVQAPQDDSLNRIVTIPIYGQVPLYPQYICPEKLTVFLQNGEVYKGTFHVDKNFPHRAFVYASLRSKGQQSQVIISGHSAMNRALDGNVVAVSIICEPGQSCINGMVIGILEKDRNKYSGSLRYIGEAENPSQLTSSSVLQFSPKKQYMPTSSLTVRELQPHLVIDSDHFPDMKTLNKVLADYEIDIIYGDWSIYSGYPTINVVSCRSSKLHKGLTLTRKKPLESSKQVESSCSEKEALMKRKEHPKRKSFQPFPKHLPKEEIVEGLNSGELVQATLRISQHNPALAWAAQNHATKDIFIKGRLRRNRALHGDVVAIRINRNSKIGIEKEVPSDDDYATDDEFVFPEITVDHERKSETVIAKISEKIEKTGRVCGEVVAIIESSLPRLYCGRLYIKNPSRLMASKLHVTFIPDDKKDPVAIVRRIDFSEALSKLSCKEAVKLLVLAEYYQWSAESPSPFARIKKILGKCGEIDAETDGILTQNQISFAEFDSSICACLPKVPWDIPPEEIEKRRDCRALDIFSIDPENARDLDDALSITDLGEGKYDVGIHIADVSHFVKPKTALDEEAQSRSTSVYMVQKVIPMLPRVLCDDLCSLKPYKDRLAFSVFVTLNEDGNIFEKWFGKTIIRSKCRLNYDQTQRLIEKKGHGPEDFESEQFQDVSQEFVPISKLSKYVFDLHRIAQNMRKSRFQNGSLSLHNNKLGFDLDPNNGFPTSFRVYEIKESNQLVEEFMLLANRCVAERISKSFPKFALLRRHPPPKQNMMQNLQMVCKKQLGLDLDVSSSDSVHKSLLKIQETLRDKRIAFEAVRNLVTKPMQNALYICSGCISEDQWRHYALGFKHYTHFTSPIRRYPDVLVHRLLDASVSLHGHHDWEDDQGVNKDTTEPLDESMMDFECKFLGEMCEHANRKKLSSQKAQQQSSVLYLAMYLRKEPFVLEGCVVEISNISFNIYINALAQSKSIFHDRLESVAKSVKRFKNPDRIEATFEVQNAKGNTLNLPREYLEFKSQERSKRLDIMLLDDGRSGEVSWSLELFEVVKVLAYTTSMSPVSIEIKVLV